MSRKHQEKQQARARARRAQEHAQQRSQRNMWIGVAVVVLLAAAGVTWWVLAQDDDPAVAISESPSPAASTAPSAAPSGGTASTETSAQSSAAATEGEEPVPAPTDDETPAEAAPCPAPTDAPTPDTTLQWDSPPPADVTEVVSATIETTCGTIVAELDGTATPQTVSNFVFLAEEGYYVGTPFHRIMADFVIQGGDPTGTGTGGPGYTFDDELDLADQVVADNDGMYPRGALAMANSGPDSNGSQFYVVQADPGYPFPPDYAVFGMVVEGMDVVDDIANGPVTGERQDQAVDPAVITDVTIEPAESS